MHLPRFYSNDTELQTILRRIRQYCCPHCQRFGTLYLHGYLYGYLETNTVIARGRRLYCSSRRRRNTGCGKTVSLLPAFVLSRLSLTAITLWKLLCAIDSGTSIRKSCQALTSPLISHVTLYRLYGRFCHVQTKIRETLTRVKAPPDSSSSSSPFSATVTHLKLIFATSKNPLVAFQRTFQKALF